MKVRQHRFRDLTLYLMFSRLPLPFVIVYSTSNSVLLGKAIQGKSDRKGRRGKYQEIKESIATSILVPVLFYDGFS
jgi:hypothetical protein